MRLRSLLWLVAAAAVIETIAVWYWFDRAGFDCYPHCDTGQVISGWTAAIVPLVVATVLAVAVIRRLLARR